MQTTKTSLFEAFDLFCAAMIELELEWTGELERSGLRWAFGDARHHLCHALFLLESATSDPALLVPNAAFELLADDTRVLAHEAYLGVLSLGQLMQQAREDELAVERAIDAAATAINRMLDELEPYVSRADTGLRRTLLDGVPIEDVLAGLG
jgi:hypothetical protein